MMSIVHCKFFKKIAALRVVDEIWLYGSRARGDNAERSDIDIAIVCPNASDIDWSEIKDIVCKADTLLEIDCVRFDAFAEDATIRSEILRDKKVLYSKRESYMSEIYTGKSFEALERAICRLNEALQAFSNMSDLIMIDFMRDSVIQRFEFTIELFWKVLRKLLKFKKVIVNNPKDTLIEAFKNEMIDNGNIWIKMLDDRNEMSHVYNEEASIKIVDNIKTYAEIMTTTYEKLKDAIKAVEGKI